MFDEVRAPSDYARKSPIEGFAEMARLVWLAPDAAAMKIISDAYPRQYEFFKDQNLLPKLT